MRNQLCVLGAFVAVCASAAADPLNLCDWEWKHVTASAAGSEPAGAWNPDTGRFMVYGGYMNGWSPETWEFDGQKWIRLDASTPRILGSVSSTEVWPRASMAYDEKRHKMCLALYYPRMGDRAASAELFEWQGGAWKLKTALPSDFQSTFVFARIHLVFDHAAGKLLVVNSLNSGDESFKRPMTGWYFDGDQFSPVAFSPDAYWTLYSQVTSDPVRRTVLLTAAWPGEPGNVHETNGSTLNPVTPFPLGPASQFPPSPTDPGNRMWGMASYYSPLHSGVVQVGGISGVFYPGQIDPEFMPNKPNGNTAAWNGSQWQVLSEASPRISGAIACFDSANSRGLLFGGRELLTEQNALGRQICLRTGAVWEFDQGEWSSLTSPPPGALMSRFAAQIDPRSGRLVVANAVRELGVGQFRQSEWDGTRWRIGPSSLNVLPLAPDDEFRMVWDPAGERMVAIVRLKNTTTSAVLFRTLAFDGTYWSQIGNDRLGMANWRLVTNTTEGKVWLTDQGQTPGVFELSGPDGNTWVQKSSMTSTFSLGSSNIDAYFDDVRNRIVLVGNPIGSPSLQTQEFDGENWTAPTVSSPFVSSIQRNTNRNWNPLLRSVVAVNWQVGRTASQTSDATPLGFPRNSDHRLAIWNGTSWQIINDGGAHPADAGYIWQDQQSGKWFSYGGTPRSDIWELVPITGDRFVRQPGDAIGYAGRNISTSFEFRGGVGAVSYSWRVNGVPITASPTVNGNTVSGWNKPTISITGLKTGTNATLDCAITAGCETYVTQPVRLFATCLGDLNGDSMVDDADFVIFVSCYDNYYTPDDKPLCRLDNSSQVTDDNDFLVFVAAYQAGACP